MPEPAHDYAKLAQRDAWLRHPVLGDPSFDAFRRNPANPICRGVPGLEWPVNGFLFADPLSGRWYLYVGHYPAGYAMGPGKEECVCTVFRSADEGARWEALGPIFLPDSFCFRGDATPLGSAPDVSVVYADGRYHLAYDWVLRGATWADVRSRQSGVGYAWSERPEGPFHRSAEPLLRNDVYARAPLLGKYDRLYASTLIRRANDWLLLVIMDSGPHYAWGLAGMTAAQPEGPYGAPTPLFHVEGDAYQPPLMEYFPAFVHGGWIYAPSTSVALNRNFQMIQRARVEEAMRPDAWEIHQHGSLWHGENREHEASGIWGQTLSGLVDGRGRLQVMFPSKDSANRGTISLAWREWAAPYADGFHLSGHAGPSLGLLKRGYGDFTLDAEFDLQGAAGLYWEYTAALGPNAPKSDATLHALSRPCGPGLRLRPGGWEMIGQEGRALAAGAAAEAVARSLRLQRRGGSVSIALDGATIWQGELSAGEGALAWLVERQSYLYVKGFLVAGAPRPATLTWLYTEALLGAGENLSDWEEVAAREFRYGLGALHRGTGGRVKWNVCGSEFALWSPRGPEYGRVELRVDSCPAGMVDLCAPTPQPSAPVWRIQGLADGPHAVVLQGVSGRLVVDCLEALQIG